MFEFLQLQSMSVNISFFFWNLESVIDLLGPEITNPVLLEVFGGSEGVCANDGACQAEGGGGWRWCVVQRW